MIMNCGILKSYRECARKELFGILLAFVLLKLFSPFASLIAQDTAISGPVPPTYFGLTVMRDRIVPVVKFSTSRAWGDWPPSDWAESNPSQGVYDFTALDSYIAANESRGTDMIYTLGNTPQWASSLPNYVSDLLPGGCAPPSNIQDWDDYLQAVVSHVAGKIKYWEIWNEPQYTTYYCGDVPTMVTLAQHAQRIIKSIDPSALILSPATTNGFTSYDGPKWLSSFLAQGGAATIDVIAFHGYRTQKAEDLLPLIASYKAVMAANGVSQLPMWDTEADGEAVQTSDNESAFLAKYFLLQWSQGISRFLWYAYDSDPQWGRLMDPTTGEILPPAVAYAQVHDWMVGATLINPCAVDPTGTWSCAFSRSGYQAEALWNSGQSVSVSLPAQFVQYLDLLGNVYPITDGTVTVGNGPILVETSSSEAAALSFAPVPPQTYGNPAFTVFASSSAKAAVSYNIVRGPATVSGSTVTPTGAGTIEIGASQPASLGFAAATASTTVNVAPTFTSLSFAPVAPQVYGGSPFSVSATSVSRGPVTYSVLSGPATVSGSIVTVTGAGTVTLGASQAATTDYVAATTTTQFAVAKGQTTLTFAPIADWPYGTTSTTFFISATSPVSGGIAYTVVSGPAILSSSHAVMPTGLGTVVLSATLPAARNYVAVTATTTFKVVPAPVPTLTFAPIGVRISGTSFSVSATSASSGRVTYSVVSGPATVSGQTISLSGAGTVVLSASQAADSHFAATTATASFNAVPRLSFASIPPQVYGGSPFSVSATSASSGPVVYSVLSGPATVSGSTVTTTGAGTVTLSAAQAATGAYAAASATTQFTVAQGHTTLTFAPIADWAYGTTATTFSVTATSSAGGGVSYAVVSGPAKVSSRAVTPTGLGTVVLSATLPATKNYVSVTTTATFIVVPAPVPTLTFTSITTPNSQGLVYVSATSASGGQVTYAVVSGPATISGHTVSLTGKGTVVLSASQAANSHYAAATASTSFQAN